MRHVFVSPPGFSPVWVTFKRDPRSALVIGWRWKDQWCHQDRYPGGRFGIVPWWNVRMDTRTQSCTWFHLKMVNPNFLELEMNQTWKFQASSFSGEPCSSSGVYGRQRNARNDRLHVVLFWWAGPLLWKLVVWKVTIVCYFVISWLHSRWSSLPISQQRFNRMHLACVVDHFHATQVCFWLLSKELNSSIYKLIKQ